MPIEEWTHHAQLTMALCYLHRYSEADAVERIRTGIQRYNRAKNDPARPSTGYHETITLFWIEILRRHLSASGESDIASLADGPADSWAHKDLLFEYYSREVLFSDQACASWVPPDLKPLPPAEVYGRLPEAGGCREIAVQEP
ncbi:MAG: hypothetical protein L0312_24720 [Acidobacteria bacterium]|nr:hypothetical protein [Acidobacteriota bacterium]